MKLLLADDHTLFRDALVQYIERAEPSAKVTLAKDFPGVLEAVEITPDQDLILLDLRMPGMNGMDGLKQVREKYPNIPVVLMSGVAENADVETAMELGAIGYFPKTLSGKALLQAIQLVLTGEKFVPLDHNTNSIVPSYYDDEKNIGTPGSSHNQSVQQEGASDIKLTPREMDVLSYLS